MKFIITTFFKGLYYFFTDKYFRTFSWLVIFYGGKPRYKTSSLKVLNYKLRVPDTRSFIWQYYEIFYKNIYKFNTSNPTPVIIDCGSNVGSSILFYSKNYPNAKIEAFEPDPVIFNYLKENISKNKINNVTLNEKAVWISNETLNFSSEGADGGNLEAGGTTEVEAVRLKDILNQHKEIDFLKMDIEGAESEVLIDCKDSLGNVKNVFIEYHSFIEKNQNVSDILEILNKSGFRYFVENAAPRMAPFINISKPGQSMDMQLNIFGYRTS